MLEATWFRRSAREHYSWDSLRSHDIASRMPQVLQSTLELSGAHPVRRRIVFQGQHFYEAFSVFRVFVDDKRLRAILRSDRERRRTRLRDVKMFRRVAKFFDRLEALAKSHGHVCLFRYRTVRGDEPISLVKAVLKECIHVVERGLLIGSRTSQWRGFAGASACNGPLY